jgi:hypothetical protein
MRSMAGGKVKVELLQRPTDAQILLVGKIDGVVGVEQPDPYGTEIIIEHAGGMDDRAQLLQKLTASGFQIVSFRPAQNTLESFYLNTMSESLD